MTAQIPDFVSSFEELNSIEKKFKDLQYQFTNQMAQDLLKLMHRLITAAARSDISLHSKVVEFQLCSNTLFEDNAININKEIFST